MVVQKVIHGLKTAWVQKGPKESRSILFLIHGCPDTPQAWEHQIQYFSKKHLVLAPFARGVGPSQPSPRKKRYSLDEILKDHLFILEKVDPKREKKVIVVGHDIGGLHAWNLAKRLEEQNRVALVLINAPELTQMTRKMFQPRQILKSWYILFFQVPLLSDMVLKNFDSLFYKLAVKLGQRADQLKASNPPGEDLTKQVYPFLNQYRQAFRQIPRVLIKPAKPLKAKTLVIWGLKDAFLVPPNVSEMKTVSEKPVLRILDGNHWLHHDKHEQVNQLMDGFIKNAFY